MNKQAYRLAVMNAYHAELKRTRSIKSKRFELNAKRRKVLVVRLLKLRRYMRIAWSGYSYGKVVRKVTCEECGGRGEIFMGMDPGGMWQPPEAIVERCEACEGKGYHE